MKLYFVGADNEVTGSLEIVNGKPVGTGDGMAIAQRITVIEPNTLVELKPADGDRYLDALRYEFRGYSRALTEEEVTQYRSQLKFMAGVK